MIDFAIRRLRPSDSLEGLTQLLHRAFSELALRGIECQCASQSVARTRERVERGECFIAVSGHQVIGTITLEAVDRHSSISTYRDPATASVHQLAVDPARQGEGIGRSLMAQAIAWAGARRHARLALDTPEGALRQVAWYFDRGFDVVETVHVPGRRYASVVLARQLARSVSNACATTPTSRVSLHSRLAVRGRGRADGLPWTPASAARLPAAQGKVSSSPAAPCEPAEESAARLPAVRPGSA